MTGFWASHCSLEYNCLPLSPGDNWYAGWTSMSGRSCPGLLVVMWEVCKAAGKVGADVPEKFSMPALAAPMNPCWYADTLRVDRGLLNQEESIDGGRWDDIYISRVKLVNVQRCVQSSKSIPWYRRLDENERTVQQLARFAHHMAKPTPIKTTGQSPLH